MAQDEGLLQALVRVALRPAVVVGQGIQIVLTDQPLERDRHSARPVQLLRRRFLRQGVRGRILADNKHLLDLGQLPSLLFLRYFGHETGQVAHLQNLHVHAGLRFDHGEVTVHIEHARIGVS